MRTTNKGWPILVDGKLFAYDKKGAVLPFWA